jgi:hypothetical protein
MVGLRRLLLTLFVVVATVAVDLVVDAADNDGDCAEEAVSIGRGGLGWQNLGVSLEPNCLISKDFAYTYSYNTAKNTTTTNSSHEEGKQQISCQYDDLTWLLHPSSGFIPNGSLCGILGPR